MLAIGVLLMIIAVLLLVGKKNRQKVSEWFASSDWSLWLMFGLLITYNAVLLLFAKEKYQKPEWLIYVVVYLGLPVLITWIAHKLKDLRKTARGFWDGWLDILIIVTVWIPVEMRWVPKMGKLSYTIAAASALIIALIVFTGWRKKELYLDWSFSCKNLRTVLFWLMAFTAFVVATAPAVIGIWIEPAVNYRDLGGLTDKLGLPTEVVLPVLFIMMWFAPALIEEFIFRAIIQNSLMDMSKAKWWPVVAIAIASIIFGVAHINNDLEINGHEIDSPSWHYVFYATIAGVAYGWVYYKTKSLQASVLLHCLVDYVWWLFFKGPVA